MTEATLFRNRKFIKIFSSYSISMFGIYFDRIAVILLFAYLWNERPLMLALIPVAFALPQVLFGQFAGILVDRFRPVRVMMAADLTSALLTLGLAFTEYAWLCILILALRSTVSVVHYPAEQSVIKKIVHPDHILKAITLNGTVAQLSKIAGPLIGGTIAGLYSPRLCILINFAALVISFLILLTLGKEEHSKKSEETGSKLPFWQAWREGWGIVIRTKVLFLSFSLSFFAFLVVQMVDIQFPILFRELAPTQPELLGWLMSGTGVGALLVISLLMRKKNLRNIGMLLGASMLLIGTSFGASSFLKEGFHIMIPLSFCLILGIGVGLHTIVTQYTLQRFTNPATIGRVSGMYNSLMSASILVAPVLGAFLVESFGVVPVLQASSLGLFVLGCIGFTGQRRLSLSDFEHLPESEVQAEG